MAVGSVGREPVVPPPPGPVHVWLQAARVPTLPAAVVPVLVGSATAWAARGQFQWGVFVAALVAALFIQIGTNFANDLFDYKKGADTEERQGPVRVTQAGWATPRQVAWATGIAFGLAFVTGMYLVFIGGWPVFVIGVVSILCGVAYTAGPWPLAYHGLGDVFSFIFFGVVAVVGTHFVHTGYVDGVAWLASIPVGLLVTAILAVNNLRDIDTDERTGKRTLSVRLGEKGARLFYVALVAGAFVVPPLMWWTGVAGPGVLLPLITYVLARPLVQAVAGGTRGKPLNRVLAGTGRLHMVYGLLLTIGLLWG